MNAPDPLPPMADGAVPPGHRLGHFEVRGTLAADENDVVYRAWDLELGIPVAIKEYLPRRLIRRTPGFGVEALDVGAGVAFEAGRDAFVDEARQLARCDDASLLRVRHLLRAHGTVYRVMPLYAGWPLLELRREMDAPPDEPALRRLLLELLDALSSWHRVAGAHGGVNPARILLLDDDRALLLGPRGVRPDAAGGAPTPPVPALPERFMAPEMRVPSAAAPTGPWSDFYSLAQVARFCITGLLPSVAGASPVEPLAEIVQRRAADAPPVRYDEALLRALDAAASPDIAHRPRTVGEFREWLLHGPPREPVEALEPAAAPAPAAPPVAFAAAAVAVPPANEAAPETATIDLIRRAVDAVAERAESAPRPAPPAPAPAERAVQADPRPMPAPATWSRRPSRRPWWLALATLLLAAVGYGAADEGWWMLWRVEQQAGGPAAALVGAAPPAEVSAAALPAPVMTSEVNGQQSAAAAPTTAPPDARAEGVPAAGPVDAAASTPAAAAPAAGPTPAADTSATAPTPAAAAAPDPVPASPPVKQPARSAADSPRQVCGERTPFSLYRCMQQQCASAAWKRHPQCVQLSADDRVD